MKVKHVFTGVVVEVDDELGKKLAKSPEWGSVRASRKDAEPKEEPKESAKEK